jgi:hypothetical protein
MWHEFSLAHLSALTLSPQEMVEVAAHCGYGYVGLRLLPVTATEPKYPLIQDRQMLRETRARIAQSGVGVLDIELARLTPEVDVASFEPMLATGAELGARHLIAQQRSSPSSASWRAATRSASISNSSRGPIRRTCSPRWRW